MTVSTDKKALEAAWDAFLSQHEVGYIPGKDPLVAMSAAIAAYLAALDPQTVTTLRSQLSGITDETSSWQPIETAPKDGTWFLGWVQRADTEDRYDIWQWDANVETDSGYGFWINAADSNLDEFPTHWQPLTSPKEPTHDQS